MDRPTPPADCAIVMGEADLHEIGRIREATPSVTELAKACGVPVREEKTAFGNTEVVADIPLRVAMEAMKPAQRLDTQRQLNMDGRIAKETLVAKDGSRRRVWAAHAEQVGRESGMRPLIRWGRPSNLRRYWLACGHYVELPSSDPVPALLECRWGCGMEEVEVPTPGGPLSAPAVFVH